MSSDHTDEIIRLRTLNLSPKQIARKLGLKPAEVTTIIRSHAEADHAARLERGELAPLDRCLIDANSFERLFNPLPPGSADDGGDDGTGGLAQVLVTRRDRNAYLMCSYLVDCWCLGVKDAMGPRKLDRLKYDQFVEGIYENFAKGYREITLEQAQAVIWGAIDYAAKLGFTPHEDFEQAQVNLGDRPETLIPLEFGYQGKPFYISGPYDNPNRIMDTLTRTVGVDNFKYLIQAGW